MVTASVVNDQSIGENYALYHGDCIDVLRGLPDSSIDYSIFSPPFSSLFTYSNSPRDLGNSTSYEQFFEHYGWVLAELRRVIKPGRLVSYHCKDLPTSKLMHGYIGLRDFSGDLTRMMEKHGFIYHSRVTIWKDPVVEMQRTKALGLLHKTVRNNSSFARQGIPDYLITMRDPREIKLDNRVTHDPEEYPVSLWQRVASPVWMDINPSDTLQRESAREHEDERHIAPLQLEVIRRAIRLWTNPGDVVLSPFAGIGSEGYVALQEGRKFVGAELKASYYRQAALNLARAADRPLTLFDMEQIDPEFVAGIRESMAYFDAGGEGKTLAEIGLEHPEWETAHDAQFDARAHFEQPPVGYAEAWANELAQPPTAYRDATNVLEELQALPPDAGPKEMGLAFDRAHARTAAEDVEIAKARDAFDRAFAHDAKMAKAKEAAAALNALLAESAP